MIWTADIWRKKKKTCIDRRKSARLAFKGLKSSPPKKQTSLMIVRMFQTLMQSMVQRSRTVWCPGGFLSRYLIDRKLGKYRIRFWFLRSLSYDYYALRSRFPIVKFLVVLKWLPVSQWQQSQRYSFGDCTKDPWDGVDYHFQTFYQLWFQIHTKNARKPS